MSNDKKETLLEFPCEFPIKAIGKQRDDLDALVFALVNKHVADLGEGAVRSRPSSKGNYCSITVTFTATSQAQLDAIYCDLSGCEHITMVL